MILREATLSYGPRRHEEGPARIASSSDVAPFVRSKIADRLTESFIAIALDSRNRPRAWTVISQGSMTACPVDAADVLRFALLAGAPALIVAHNHPSGDPSPSPEDLVLTARLVEAARVVGIRILDHIIVGEDGHFSFLDAGLMHRGGGR